MRWNRGIADSLLLEMMDAPLGMTERCLVHLARIGGFDGIKALLWGRIENPDSNADDERYRAMLREFVPGDLPIVTEVDVSHTVPMLTLGQGTLVSLEAPEDGQASVTILEPMVEG